MQTYYAAETMPCAICRGLIAVERKYQDTDIGRIHEFPSECAANVDEAHTTLQLSLAAALAEKEKVTAENEALQSEIKMLRDREQLACFAIAEATRPKMELREAKSLITSLQLSLDRLQKENERLQYANRTRPDYDLRCTQCGAAHNIDTSIPSDLWNQITTPSDILCVVCIDEKLEAKGLSTDKTEFYYHGMALSSRMYAETSGEIQRLEREVADAQRQAKEERQQAIAFAKAFLARGGFTSDATDWHIFTPRHTVKKAIDYLISVGLIERKGDEYRFLPEPKSAEGEGDGYE